MAKLTNTKPPKWVPPSAEEREKVPFLDRELTKKIMWYARDTDPREKALLNAVKDACKAMKIKKVPPVLIYQDDAPNAYSNTINGNLAFSTNIVDLLPPEQLRAIIGHELAHNQVRKRNIITIYGISIGAFATAVAGNHYVGPHNIDRPIDFIGVDLELAAVGLAGGVTQAALSRQRELAADKKAAKALGARHTKEALKAVHQRIDQIYEKNHYDPIFTKDESNIASTHPTFAKRLERLEKMEAKETGKDR